MISWVPFIGDSVRAVQEDTYLLNSLFDTHSSPTGIVMKTR